MTLRIPFYINLLSRISCVLHISLLYSYSFLVRNAKVLKLNILKPEMTLILRECKILK